MKLRTCQPCPIVIFGGTGDPSRRKLLPALRRIVARGHISPACHILATGRRDTYDDASFRTMAREALDHAEVGDDVAKRMGLS